MRSGLADIALKACTSVELPALPPACRIRRRRRREVVVEAGTRAGGGGVWARVGGLERALSTLRSGNGGAQQREGKGESEGD